MKLYIIYCISVVYAVYSSYKYTKSAQFCGYSSRLEGQKNKISFFNQMDALIDWRPISNVIYKHYTKGSTAVGKPSYDGLLLFKMCLLQTWYGLSDYEVVDRVNDSISFSKFCGLTLEHPLTGPQYTK